MCVRINSGPPLYIFLQNEDEIYLERDRVYSRRCASIARCARLLAFLNQQNSGERTLSLDARVRGAVHLMCALLIGARACIPRSYEIYMYVCTYVHIPGSVRTRPYSSSSNHNIAQRARHTPSDSPEGRVYVTHRPSVYVYQ